MKRLKSVIGLFIVMSLTQASLAATERVKPALLQYTPEFILQQVLIKKNISFRDDVAMPAIYLESKTSLQQFQNAIESQWNFRPAVFTNAYAVKNNEIYILDEAKYYDESKRCMDDSLAHELTHYVQVKYKNYDLNDESLEWDAIEVQTWFRDNFCKF
ncbi:MAG: hypothetical protein H7328_04930 [Bdellovibrio sp.]|nr:hypothetical protein [Bdellovibrio sp.]